MAKCPECNSENLKKAGHNEWRNVPNTGLRKQVQKYRCKKCGHMFIPPEEWKTEVNVGK